MAWLTVFLVGRFDRCLFGWLDGWMDGWIIGRLVGWLGGWEVV